jgi:hypothetical protein
MTAQEIFDRVWTHFVVEGNPRSMDEDGDCVYRGPEGQKCAVGIFIPDTEYRSGIEGSDAKALLSGSDCPPSLVPMREHADLLDDLQIAHDGACNGNGDVDPRLRIVANEHSLTIPEVSP